jgi:hypothetical protein
MSITRVRRWRKTRAILGSVLAALAIAGGSAFPVRAAPPVVSVEHESQPVTDVTPATEAAALADRLTKASTHQEHVNAVMAIMQAIRVGVYTGDGRRVLAGEERGWSDFYLYDFEVNSLAYSLERGDEWRIADIAAVLDKLGLLPEGEHVAPDDLGTALHDAIVWADQNPAEARTIVPLLV